MNPIRSICFKVPVVAALSTMVLFTGCSSSSGGREASHKTVDVAPIAISGSPRTVAAESDHRAASVNNARDLAAAQPESVIMGSARDFGDGDQRGGQPLTYQMLGETLRNLGLHPEDKGDNYQMVVKTNTDDGMSWTYPIFLSLSRDRNMIWISCAVTKINQTPSVQALANLLTANNKLGSCFFVLDDHHFLLLERTLDNTGVSPQLLGANLKLFFTALKQSEPVYKVFSGSGADGDNRGSSPFGS